MSNYLAIATVTATLKELVDVTLKNEKPPINFDFEVTTKRPDAKDNQPSDKARVNIFLYQVTPNAAYRNEDLPTRRSNGEVAQRPRVALDLHYLFTVFDADEGKLEAQRLLGSVARTLHAHPILTRDDIRDVITDPQYSFLAPSNLADDIELVKFTPTSISLEELSKLWSVFFQIPYALSVTYQGTVVLIEAEAAPRVALPVLKRNIVVLPFRNPVIEQIISQEGANIPIQANSTILIQGKNLRGDDTRVRIAGELVPPQDVSNTQVSLPLTTPAIAGKLRAGLQAVQIVHVIFQGPPPYGFESNVAAFVLSASFNSEDISFDANTNTMTINNIMPSVGMTQRVILLLNEIEPPPERPPNSYSFNAESRKVDTDPIKFKIPEDVQGEYLVRIQIDGSESPLQFDETQGKFIGPKVRINASVPPVRRTLTTTINPAGSGSIARHPNRTTYNDGESVELTAQPSSGFRFVQWSGDTSGANPADVTITVVMNQNRAITARFEAIPPNQRTLTTNVEPAGSGGIARHPDKAAYNDDESVLLTAVPVSGFIFLEWSGDIGNTNATDSSITLVMDRNRNVTARFRPISSPGMITFEEIKTGESSDSGTVTTSDSLSGVSNHLYLAAISTKPHREVTNVTGLGLTWTRVRTQCAGRNQTGMQVWRAQGTPSGDGAVTATLSDTPKNTVIAVSRYSGVDTGNPIGRVISGNTNGLDGACSGGDDNDTYSFDITTTVDKAVVYGAIAMRQRRHTPGEGYTKRGELSKGSGGDAAGLFVEDTHVPSVGMTRFDGSFNDEVDWAVLALEIRPRTS
jgi:hypothetical protein